jgi:hypothetical protein
MNTIQLLGSTMGLGFLAGLRLYSTVLVLGLGLRYGFLHAPPGYEQHTATLTSPIVLTAAGIAWIAEFFADKVPWVDSVWDAFHTFIRPLGAVWLGFAAFGSNDPALTAAVAILCGGVAFASHSSKAAARLAVNHSPEPFSNIAMSLAGDLLVPFGVWLAWTHPALVLGLVLLFLSAFAWLLPRVFRLVRLQVTALLAWLAGPSSSPAPAVNHPRLPGLARHAVPLPAPYAAASGETTGIRCAATKRIRGFANSIGYLAISADRLTFVTRRLFRYRVHQIPAGQILAAEIKPGLLLDRLILRSTDGELVFYLFKTGK